MRDAYVDQVQVPGTTSMMICTEMGAQLSSSVRRWPGVQYEYAHALNAVGYVHAVCTVF